MKFIIAVSLLSLAFFACQEKKDEESTAVADITIVADSALPSWSTEKRERILNWVASSTDSVSKDFIPVEDRISVFDNDGTLWTEQPIPNQLQFAIDYVVSASAQHPEWQKDPVLKGISVGDIGPLMKAGKKGLMTILSVSHFNIPELVFKSNVQQWLDTAKDKKFHQRYLDLVYQPMLELLDYLRKNQFKTFIVSGGGADFMRAWVEKVYGIPPYQVIGSYGEATFTLKDSVPVITKVSGDVYLDDKEAKPVAIHRFIGKVPVLCGGNSDGDLAMMQYTAGSKYKSLNILLHHTDDTREFQYDLKTLSGHLEKALTEANQRNWLVVDMKNDFKKIFPFQ